MVSHTCQKDRQMESTYGGWENRSLGITGPGGEGQAAGSQADMEQGADRSSAGGRLLWTPFQGKTSVSEASGLRGSGLELKEPNFP